MKELSIIYDALPSLYQLSMSSCQIYENHYKLLSNEFKPYAKLSKTLNDDTGFAHMVFEQLVEFGLVEKQRTQIMRCGVCYGWRSSYRRAI